MARPERPRPPPTFPTRPAWERTLRLNSSSRRRPRATTRCGPWRRRRCRRNPIPRPPAAAGAAAPAPPAAPQAGNYTVQVAAVSRREDADGIVNHLKTKRYEAYVVAPEPGDKPAMFRVRIGSFKDKRQADRLAEQLLREDKRYKPWVTR